MSLPWAMLAPAIAFAITLLAMELAVAMTGMMRRHDFRLFEDRSAETFRRQFPIPKLDRSPAQERSDVLAPLVGAVHKTAIEAQTVYHNAVVRSAGSLAVAFLALVLGTLPRQSWNWLQVDYEAVEQVLTWLDAITIVLVLALFIRGRAVSARWLANRSVVELLRQYQFLTIVFPGRETAISEVKPRFDLEADAVRDCIQEGPITDIIARIERYWSKRRTSIEDRVLTDADISPDALLVYLRKRPLRQLSWFSDSQARLEHIAERRNIILVSLYSVSALIAVVKLALFLQCGHAPAVMLPLLLIATGMSAECPQPHPSLQHSAPAH